MGGQGRARSGDLKVATVRMWTNRVHSLGAIAIVAKKLDAWGKALLLQPYVQNLPGRARCPARHAPVAADMVQRQEFAGRFTTACAANSAYGVMRSGFVANVIQARQCRIPRACPAARLEPPSAA